MPRVGKSMDRKAAFRRSELAEVNHRKSSARNCAILERTGDGVAVGRCLHYLSDGQTCPRHGDVSTVQAHYLETGKLTDENEFRRCTCSATLKWDPPAHAPHCARSRS